MLNLKTIKKLTSGFLALVVVFSVVNFGGDVNVRAASSVSDLETKYSELEKKLEKLKSEMSKTQSEKKQTLLYKNQLDTEISIVEQQIENLNRQTTELNAQIKANEALLAKKESEILENDELFKSRLRAMYVSSDTSIWEVIFGSKSYSDFLMNTEYMKRLAESDQQLMQKLNQDKKTIIAAKENIENSKIKLDANKQTLSIKKGSLNTKYQESQKLLNTLTQEENSLKSEQIKINEEMEEIDEEIRQMLANNGSNGDFVGGEFLWPVPNYSTITSKFGWRTLYGRKNWHTGIDISGANVYGKNIVAANSGTVIKAVTSYVPKKGYGKYVIIDHGGGYTTLYGHCSSLLVKVGQTVKRGDPIALVGSTGNSTGPHLHFGIYVNGKEVDPLPYL
ncbi:MAG: peptidoglycan DD-metalloendopeptidase family protein [Oscillospiraceae bacterium]|nr:peptidoglycan DD-metalloendopeptidase family protein [Oscillospiraceae bacterium]